MLLDTDRVDSRSCGAACLFWSSIDREVNQVKRQLNITSTTYGTKHRESSSGQIFVLSVSHLPLPFGKIELID
jgi:hypothetical protein